MSVVWFMKSGRSALIVQLSRWSRFVAQQTVVVAADKRPDTFERPDQLVPPQLRHLVLVLLEGHKWGSPLEPLARPDSAMFPPECAW